ncbi:hypothetical protein GLIP_2751 [Aliiglaciecola lipolytica E3]|uniref:Uncharacterized protein n=1 Tax=Aliiglaciecola lipolytica E3 TaxID=1127673 RepID=K6YB16_9ALTE|nr:hypothetical protein GLIP_2751 [Aliiglaciecola lipolytica E3]
MMLAGNGMAVVICMVLPTHKNIKMQEMEKIVLKTVVNT